MIGGGGGGCVFWPQSTNTLRAKERDFSLLFLSSFLSLAAESVATVSSRAAVVVRNTQSASLAWLFAAAAVPH